MNPAPHTTEATFPSELQSVRAARHFVRQSLTAAQWTRSRLADIELATSEMSTNAIEHGEGSTFAVTVGMWDDRVEVIVRSSGSVRKPVIQPSSPLSLSGRGLRIVSTVADDFRVEQTFEHVAVSCAFVQPIPVGGKINLSTTQGAGAQLSPTVPEAPNTR